MKIGRGQEMQELPQEIHSKKGKYKAVINKQGRYSIYEMSKEGWYRLTFSTSYKTVLDLFDYWESGLCFMEWKGRKEKEENGKI